jgi:CheY-like chemotaxis protein
MSDGTAGRHSSEWPKENQSLFCFGRVTGLYAGRQERPATLRKGNLYTFPPSKVRALPNTGAEDLAITRRKVLLVDDNADAVAVISAYLKRAGHEVHEARDGFAAADLARRLRPDFVFLDLGLPGIDGLAVARQLRADPQLSGMRIIAMTGSGREDDRQAARDAGFEQYLLKPIDLDFVRSLLG